MKNIFLAFTLLLLISCGKDDAASGGGSASSTTCKEFWSEWTRTNDSNYVLYLQNLKKFNTKILSYVYVNNKTLGLYTCYFYVEFIGNDKEGTAYITKGDYNNYSLTEEQLSECNTVVDAYSYVKTCNNLQFTSQTKNTDPNIYK